MRLQRARSNLVRGNIHPVPDMRNPSLGVHFARGGDGEVYIGPTAIPAFGRDNYGLFERMDGEAVDILIRDAILLFSDPGFRSAALNEPKKLVKRYVCRVAKRLVPAPKLDDVEGFNKVGILSQWVDWPKRGMVSGSLIVKDDVSLQVLNALSPAFTSCMTFARHAIDQMMGEQEREESLHAVRVQAS